MLSGYRVTRRSENPLGKHERVRPLGVQQFSEQLYRGFRFQIGRRTLGMTVKRVTYSVAIRCGDGHESGYLTDLTSLDAAQEAARAWIDQQRESHAATGRKAWQTLLAQSPAGAPRPVT